MPIIPLTFVAFLPLGLAMNHPSPLFAGALGPFLLFRRNTYLRRGGHAAVATDIVEDMQLSRLVKRSGGRVVWIDGTTVMRVRMYHSFVEAWRGIAKSAFAAISYSRPALLVGGPACAALFWGPYLFLAAGLFNRSASSVVLWLPLIQILFLGTSYLLLLRRFHLPLALVFFQAGTVLATVFITAYSAAKTSFGEGVAWKGRTYRFDVLRRGNTHFRWATGLTVVRLLIAALLRWSGATGAGLQVATALLLLGWTVALIEHAARKGAWSRRSMWVSVVEGLACLGYLQLSGLISISLTLSIVLVIALCERWFPWQIVAVMATVLPGSILIIAAEMHAPNKILLGWLILIALVASRSIAQLAIPWLQRFRSSR
jgi:hypothetical protein